MHRLGRKRLYIAQPTVIDSIYLTRDCVPACIKENVRIVIIDTFPLMSFGGMQRERGYCGWFVDSLRLQTAIGIVRLVRHCVELALNLSKLH